MTYYWRTGGIAFARLWRLIKQINIPGEFKTML